MTALLKLFWRLCVFRAGPEQTPYSGSLLVATLAGWLLVQTAVANLQTGLSLGHMLIAQLIAMTTLLSLTGLLLYFKGLLARWLQTCLALIGVAIILDLVSMPLLALNLALPQPLPFINGIYLILVSWQLAAQSFIFHRSMNVSPFLGLALAFTFLVVSYLAIGMLMPGVLGSSVQQ